jgi:hypothetical protein
MTPTPSGPGHADGPAPASPGEAPGGLRRLVYRLGQPEAGQIALERPAPPPCEAVPDLLVERMEDAALGHRLAAVLRREAQREGIDLEGGD